MPLNLLIASSSPPDKGSGINAYVNNICESFVNQGLSIHYLSPPQKDKSWLEQNQIRHIAIGQNDEPVQSARRLVTFIHENHIQGIINNDNAILQSIAPLVPCPMIAVGHMSKSSVATLACYNHHWLDYVVAISPDMQRVYTDKYKVPLVKVPIIFNGVGDPGAGVSDTMKAGKLNIVFAGGDKKHKGAELLLSSLNEPLIPWEKITLHWFGQVSKKYLTVINETPSVHYHGRVGRKRFHDTLKECDVLLFPSRAEGCPMTILEAMSYGLLCISSDGVGAMRWMITSGQDGFICSLKNWSRELAQCLIYLLNDSSALAEMKSASHDRFLRDFKTSQTTDKLLWLLRHPTVDRRRQKKNSTILKWHRPVGSDGQTAPLLDRLYIRSGFLKKAGTLALKD
jgi:glycosyltransferase involved in cell wall biosynthesis